MRLPEPDFQAFLQLLEPAAAKQEVACARYLQNATLRLFPSFPDQELTVEFEQRMHFGRSDFLVVGDFKSDIGRKERRVYFWELKAAQCFAFQRDDADTRLRPTLDLIKAETQLLHYVEEAKGSNIFCRTYEVLPSNVKMGGIIIGRDDRLWDPDDRRISHRDAPVSLSLRKEVIYDRIDIRLMTWDRIVEDLRPIAA